jgi:hypothetical protein
VRSEEWLWRRIKSCSAAIFKSRLSEADPSPALWVHPSLRGHGLANFLKICMITNRMPLFAAKPLDLNSLHSILNSFPIMQALGEGPTKGAGWMRQSRGFSTFFTQFSILPLSLLRMSRLSEADPSPALWAAPFSKEARAYRFPR